MIIQNSYLASSSRQVRRESALACSRQTSYFAVVAAAAAAAMDPLTKKEMLGKFHETCEQYVVDYLIGQGAFGKVFKAHRKDNPGKFVAIKHMNSVREVD